MRAIEVMKRLGVSRMTMNNYVRHGKIRVSHKLSKRLFIYDDKSVEKFIEESKVR